jgi:hypothetical protein
MTPPTGSWFVSLPDGRIIRASDTKHLRELVRGGRIPLASRVRRSSDEEWTPLEETDEFADLVSIALGEGGGSGTRLGQATDSAILRGEAGGASRLDPQRLRALGVRGLIDELAAALDCALVRAKLAPTMLAMLAIVAVLHGARGAAVQFAAPSLLGLGGFVVLAIVATHHALLAQLAFIELTRLRPARWNEALAGWLGRSIRLAIAYCLIPGLPLAALVFLREAPGWLGTRLGWLPWLTALLSATTAIVEVGLWFVVLASPMLGVILVVEDSAIGSAMARWLTLWRGHFSRLLFAQAFAMVVGVVLAIPLFVPIVLTAGSTTLADLSHVRLATLGVLSALAFAPCFTYLIVANVFVYLFLGYESPPQR